MNKRPFFQSILIVIIAVVFASCDKDFNEIGTDIIGDNNFLFEIDSLSSVKAYNQKLGPIASSNLPINPLGFYTNPTFGTTKANFVTQVELSTVNPKFNNIDPEEYDVNPTIIDSVVMEIPYFININKTKVDATDSTKRTYVLDSIFGATLTDQTAATNNAKFKLSVYQSHYYLRNLDPSQSLTEQQLFYNDLDNEINNNKIPVLLNDKVTADEHENNKFYFDKREHRTIASFAADGTTPIYARTPPSMRLHLRKDVFNNAILNAPSGQLSDNTIFKNYFRGLYFKVENTGNEGNMAMINFRAGKVTIYYNEDNKKTATDGVITYQRANKTFALNLTGNSVSLLENTNENIDYLTVANNTTQEAKQLYLKGGEGSIAIIDLFSATDTKGYIRNDSFNINLPVSGTNPKYILTGPNGKSDEIDDIIFNGWLINEANLIFYVNKTAMADINTVEPDRIFLYDLTNNKVISDYVFDIASDQLFPKRNKFVFGGILLNNDNSYVKQIKNNDGKITNKGTKYKIRITSYIRNLIKNDSTNVRLGLSVTENINNFNFSKLKNPNNNFSSVPAMSVLSPLGTVLYGTGQTSPTLPEGKKLKLEIYYTKPN